MKAYYTPKDPKNIQKFFIFIVTTSFVNNELQTEKFKLLFKKLIRS